MEQNFNGTQVLDEILDIIQKYSMTYYQFEKVIEKVKETVSNYSVVNLPNHPELFKGKPIKKRKCECGGEYHLRKEDYGNVFLSDPWRYSIQCEKCKNINYVFRDEYEFYLNDFCLKEFTKSKMAEALTQRVIPTGQDDCRISPESITGGVCSFPPPW